MDVESYKSKPLNTKWTIWVHFSQDTSWDLDSYYKIMMVDKVYDVIYICKYLEKLFPNMMVFVMRDDILPIWEHPKNRDGGAYSYKIAEEHVVGVWNYLLFRVIGETLMHDANSMSLVTGLTISPKKNFYIIKVWMQSCIGNDQIKLHDDFEQPHDGRIFTAFYVT